MEKLTGEMDLGEWDFLSDDEEVGRGMLVSAKLDSIPKEGFVMNYFPRSPTNQSKKFSVSDKEVVKEVIKLPIQLGKNQDQDQEMISQQVSFEKSKGTNKFVDIKMDSPKSRASKIQEIGSLPFLDLKEDFNSNPIEEIEKKGDGAGFNIWSWRLTGIGALCSIGMVAATICIFVIGSQQKDKHNQQNQKLRFQIYPDDKRFKQVVHHATKLNQTICSVRGGPFNSAHITFGGYYVYDGL